MKFFIFIIAFSTTAAHAADEWLIARATMSGACHIQKTTSSPYLGVDLGGRYSTLKDACNAAKALKTDDPTESSKCLAYSNGAVEGCKKHGVKL